MKKLLMFSLFATSLFTSTQSMAQGADKSKRPSPPATVTAATSNSNTITINYSQPSVKGRTIGKDIAPYDKVWRAGANEATTFEITKDAKIDKKSSLPAGKYSLYAIPGEKTWTIIFNKKWEQWGTVYNEGEDALRVTTTPKKAAGFTEQLTYTIDKKGQVTLTWGDTSAGFTVN